MFIFEGIISRRWIMAIPVNNDIDIEMFRASQIRDTFKTIGEGRKDMQETASFDRILKNTLEINDAEKNIAFNPASLDRGKLKNIIEIIQLQMSRSAFTAFNDTDEEETSGFYLTKRMDFSGIAAQFTSSPSKIKQPVPKIDREPPKNNLDNIIENASKKYDVDEGLIRAVVKAESNFKTQSTSPKGAMGLMQLMPETAKELGVNDPYDPAENIMGGTRYLKQLLKRYDGDIPTALSAYNWGMGNVEKYPDRLPGETRDYIAKVTSYYQKVRS
jgi:hypothetical protein